MVKANRRKLRPRPLVYGDPRTSMAGRHRNLNYQLRQEVDYQSYHMKIGKKLATEGYYEETGASHSGHYQQRPNQQIRITSPSTSTDSSSSSTAEPDTDSQMKYDSHYLGRNIQPDIIADSQPRLGTLQSMQSALITWQGEPCPVHHTNAAPISLISTRPSPPHYAIQTHSTPPPPPMLLPAVLQPGPLVLAAENPAPPSPFPVHDPRAPIELTSRKLLHYNSKNCCSDNMILLLIILCIVLLGVLFGVISRFLVV